MGERSHETTSTGDEPSVRSAARGFVVDLRDPAALDRDVTGSKAAALAAVALHGLDVLPGVVLTTGFCAAVDAGAAVAEHPAVQAAFTLADGEGRALVARSSSVLEDTAGSSMAGQFDSVIGISGFDEFVAAVQRVPRLARSQRSVGHADRSPRPTAHRATLRRRHVRDRPGHRSERSPHRRRDPRWTRAAGERRGRRLALRARPRRQCHPLRAGRRPGAVTATAAPTRGGGRRGGARLRRPARRRVGDRGRRRPVAVAVPPRHDGGPRCPPRPDLRAGADRRDVPRTAHRARARPLGATIARRRPGSGAARRCRDARRGRGERGRRQRRGSRGHRPAPRRRDPPEAGRAPALEPGSRIAAPPTRMEGRSPAAPRCRRSPRSSSIGSTPTSERCRHSRSSPVASWSRSSIAGMSCSAPCTRTRS